MKKMEPLRISRLDIQQIGPFGDLTLHFPEKPAGSERLAEIHIFTGENGTGKSTILEVLVGSLRGAFDNSFREKYRREDAITVNCHFGNHGSFLLKQGGILEDSPALFTFRRSFLSDLGFEFAAFAYSGYRKVSSVKIDGIRELNQPAMGGAMDFNATSNPGEIFQWIANTISAEAIAQVQNEQTEAQQRRQALENLENAISGIIQKKVKFKLETKPYAVKIEVDGERLGFNLLPDGLKSIISWLADLLMRMDRVKWVDDVPVFERNFMLFLDEIEVHMHPAWQRKILPAVQKLFPNAQIFISTHSPFVVGSVDGAWIHKLVKPNGDSKLAAGYPMLSQDAKSYRYWLDEVFDIQSEYGVAAEQELKKFYELRDNVLRGANGTVQKSLVQTSEKLAEQSDELRQIIEMELRQVNRHQSLQLSL